MRGPARLQSDVVLIAEPRPPGSTHWQAIQDLCADRFQQYGFEVERHQYATGVNVIGKRAGSTTPGEQVIISAHYDHIPDCPGADDNASGVAAVLETARVLAGAAFDRTLVLACWDEEEDGLIGSEAYATRAAQNNETIVSMVSLEMIGYRSDSNSQTTPAGFNLLFADEY
jgi:Zn-dependent M28 family amino/carboxypeptidase